MNDDCNRSIRLNNLTNVNSIEASNNNNNKIKYFENNILREHLSTFVSVDSLNVNKAKNQFICY